MLSKPKELNIEAIYEEVRMAFDQEVSKPTPNQIDIMATFDRAWAIGLARYARKNGIIID
jgi:hypothetical protein